MRADTRPDHRSEIAIDAIGRSRARAEQWLLNSGICILDKSNPNYGAVYSYFDCATKSFELVYSEATGYLISLLRYFYSVRGDPEPVRRAVAAGEWLLRMGDKHGGIIVMGQQGTQQVRRAYSFDNGICCKGLLDLYQLTRDDRFARRAEGIAEWLVDRALNEDGSVKPVMDVESGAFIKGSVWYEVSGSFHSKVAISLLQLHSINGDRRFRDGALRICRWALGQQAPSGYFPVNTHSRAVNLHFHCYTVEALLYTYAVTGERAFADAATRGIDWLTSVQDARGAFWLWHGRRRWRMSRASYVSAQASRLFLMMWLLNADARFVDAARRTAGFLTQMQVSSEDPRIDGGFLEEEMAWHALAGRRDRRITSWATLFAVHALALLEGSRAEDFGHAMSAMF